MTLLLEQLKILRVVKPISILCFRINRLGNGIRWKEMCSDWFMQQSEAHLSVKFKVPQTIIFFNEPSSTIIVIILRSKIIKYVM